MKAIVGLGNPGKKYERTRHNIGFMVLDALAKERSIPIKKKAFSSEIGQGNICQQQVLLIKPQTYMNLSGIAVKAIIDKLDNSSDLLVVYDDVDVPFGEIRFRKDGSSAGHNGITSIIEELSTRDFHRLRIGIRPEHELRDITSFVLSDFSSQERSLMEKNIQRSVEAIQSWLKEDIVKCMNLYN